MICICLIRVLVEENGTLIFLNKVHPGLILLSLLVGDFMKDTEQLWQQVFDTHYYNVYGFFLKRLGSPEDAADASQETFMRVVRREGAIKIGSPAGYIWRTAQNLIKEIKRNKALTAKWISSKAMDLEQQASQTPTPEKAMEIQKTNDDILNVLDRLPPRCREVFILHRFKGLSHKQIAGQLNISPKTVENHMINALLFFHKHLYPP